jgi:hypothetical protein
MMHQKKMKKIILLTLVIQIEEKKVEIEDEEVKKIMNLMIF